MKLLKLIAPLVLVLSVSTINAQVEATEEQSKIIEKRFKHLDGNGDGTVSLEEIIAKDKKQLGEKFEEKKSKYKFNKFDANKDGSVSKEEFSTKMVAFLNKKK